MVRPTIGYSLTCEAQGQSREQAYSSLQSAVDYGAYQDANRYRKFGITIMVFALALGHYGFSIFKVAEQNEEVCGCFTLFYMTFLFTLYMPLIVWY